jgi:hypothetical protein
MSSSYEKKLRALGVHTNNTNNTHLSTDDSHESDIVEPRKLLVVGGSTRLNRFSSVNSTPKFRGVNKAPRQAKGTTNPSNDTTIFDRISLLLFPSDVLCNTFRFLEPSDLQHLCATGKPYAQIPHDNYLWYKLTVQRFVTNAKSNNRDTSAPPMPWAQTKEIPPMSAVRNWRDEYEYLLAQESRAQKFQMKQMQGRLGRLPPIPPHKDRDVVNFFTTGRSHVSTADTTASRASTNVPTKFSNPILKEGTSNLSNRQGLGMWLSLKQRVPEEIDGEMEIH